MDRSPFLHGVWETIGHFIRGAGKPTVKLPHGWVREETGTVAILFGLMILPIMGSAGLATDVSRTWMSRSKLDYAVDAAALAVASSIGSQEQMEERAEAFVNANYTDNDFTGKITEIDVQMGLNTVTVTVEARVPTSMMRVVGKEYVDIRSTATTVRELLGIEVALVLDNTGSMRSNNNIGALREASHIFVDAVTAEGDDEVSDRLRIALVPYSAQVNPGEEAVSLVQNPGTKPTYHFKSPVRWKGCVQERDYPHDVLDTSIAEGGHWEKSVWEKAPDNDYQGLGTINNDVHACNKQTGPNLGCPTPITPLTNDFEDVRDAIDDLRAWCRGGTIGSIGMSWGWRVLSPEPPFTQGEAYNSDRWMKVAIMMTDGDNLVWRYNVNGNEFASDYTAYGRLDDMRLGTTNRNTAKGVINNRLEEACDGMKAAGITIYTITFTSGISNSTKDIYRRCASSSDKYYDAPTQAALRETFATIGGELTNLRLTQ